MDLTFYCGERENKTIYSKQYRQNRVTSTAEEKKNTVWNRILECQGHRIQKQSGQARPH